MRAFTVELLFPLAAATRAELKHPAGFSPTVGRRRSIWAAVMTRPEVFYSQVQPDDKKLSRTPTTRATRISTTRWRVCGVRRWSQNGPLRARSAHFFG